MTDVIGGLVLVAGVLAGWFVWVAMNPPRAIGWTPAASWFERGLAHLDRWLRHRWHPVTRRQADILAIPPWRVVGFYLIAAGGGGLLGYDVMHGLVGAVLAGGLAAWKGPSWVIGKQFHQRRAVLVRDFPPLVLMLRIYLALGEPLVVALGHTRPAISSVGRHELDRLLSAVHFGERQAALKEWARRTGFPPYGLLADTLAQGWDQGLTEGALEPLDTLIESSREQGTRALTDRLDGMSTIVPVIAAFGVIAVLMYALLVGSGIT